MGDIADFYIERMTAMPRVLVPYRPAEPVACRSCKSQNVVWTQRGGAWRLYENGRPHVCVPNADGFEDCSTPETSL